MSSDQKVFDAIIKKHGEGSIVKLGEAPRMNVEVIPSGSLALDLAIGVGGIPRGRIVEIYGPEASGKTTLCQHIVAEAQKIGLVAVYIDVEHALDRQYMARTGVRVDELWISQPDTGEQAGDILEQLARSGQVGVVIVDSVAALLPMKEQEAEVGDAMMGVQARLMGQILRKVAGAARTTNTTIVFTNQLRQKIGVMFGNPETTPGGNALKFYASLRLDIRRREILKNSAAEVIGSSSRIKVVKNKVGRPFGEVLITMLNDRGISKAADIAVLATTFGLLTAKGAHIYYGDTRIAQGKVQLQAYIDNNPEFAQMLEGQIKDVAKTSPEIIVATEEEAPEE